MHLIISDINMHNMDGITFMKTLPEHKFSPIIMLTSGFLKNTREQAREAGVKAWMIKLFDKPSCWKWLRALPCRKRYLWLDRVNILLEE